MLVYATGELEQDVVVAGEVEPILTVSTSGTDSDFVVKLIDVYPNDYPDTEPTPDNPAVVRRGGYQQLVRGEPFRGKFRNSTLKHPEPEPFIPGKPTSIPYKRRDYFKIILTIGKSQQDGEDRRGKRQVRLGRGGRGAHEAKIYPSTTYRQRIYS